MADEKNMEAQILEAAEQLFQEQGFAKTTTGQIAKQAGCNQALVHYYYRTKDKLFDQIFEKRAKAVLRNFLDVKTKGITFEEKLVMKIETYFDFLENNAKLPVFLYNELSVNPERIKFLIDKIKNVSEDFVEQMDRELQEEIEKGNIKLISIGDLFFTIICLCITPFLLKPVMQSTFQINDEQINTIIKDRRKETIQTILSRLKP
jgi:AcrR family transcriptional regulator